MSEVVAGGNYIPRKRSVHLSTEEIDEQRQENAAYEYLCHLEEARMWMQNYLGEDFPPLAEFEERLRNGVYFAKLGHCIAPHVIPLKKIYDSQQNIYNTVGLRYRHTDNINHWKTAMRAIGLPKYFYPNTVDVYEKKNMPKAIYCVHALSIFLSTYDKGIKIEDLLGKIDFSTDVINSVRQEFQKYGIQLPTFGKISSILAREVPTGNDSFHTAIIAINIAINKQNLECLLLSLKNANAKLDVVDECIEMYQAALYKSKISKCLKVRRQTLNDNYTSTFYDNLLTCEEIQLCIYATNLDEVLKKLKTVVSMNDVSSMKVILEDPYLGIQSVISSNCDTYLKHLQAAFNNSDFLSKSEIANVVTKVNNLMSQDENTDKLLFDLDNELECGDCDNSFAIIKSDVLKLGNILDFGKMIYYSDLLKAKYNAVEKLSLSDVQSTVSLSTAVLMCNKIIHEGLADELHDALINLQIMQPDLIINCENNYFLALKHCMSKKSTLFPILTCEEILCCIREVNSQTETQFTHEKLIEELNFVIKEGCQDSLLELLLHPDMIILCVEPKHIVLYRSMLKALKHRSGFLSHYDIQEIINVGNELMYEAKLKCSLIIAINSSVEDFNAFKLVESLEIFMKENEVCFKCQDKYLKLLTETKYEKTSEYSYKIAKGSWIEYSVAEIKMYFNRQTLEILWEAPKKGHLYLGLNQDDIVDCIKRVQEECTCKTYEYLEPFIISLQSSIRGYLARQNIAFSDCYSSVHYKAVIKLQSFFKMILARKRYIVHQENKLRLENAARVIQRYWQEFKIKQNLKILTYNSNPPLSLIQKIIHMLEISNDDYSDEFKLHTLQGKVVQTIRRNQQLEKEVCDMDIKIGLLIRNRISLEDLVSQKHKICKKKMADLKQIEMIHNKSHMYFNKESNTLLASYENLLYLLQTQPVYFARLIVSLSASQSEMFIESIIFSLYNYGSTQREEYLLLKLFSIALEEEIRLNVNKISDIITDNQYIIKLIISYNRKGQKQNSLKELLLPLIKTVLDDQMEINSMDPVEIYKVWLNETEANTGVKSDLPYEITIEDALLHAEVNSKFISNLDNLLGHSLKFCKAILNSKKFIPYGMLHAAKTIKLSLQRKFPHVPQNEILKIVGNFLYYRYLNPAISSPDIFNILELHHDLGIDDKYRWKLTYIAKFIQFAAMGQTYTTEYDHLMCLNPYLKDCHEKFLEFLEDVCEVEHLEEHFNMDLYSEALLMIPPVVYLTVEDLDDMHKLLLEKQNSLAPDSTDVFHEILEDFGSTEIKDIFTNDSEKNETELCLTLRSKYSFQAEDETDLYKTYVETKFMLITLLQVCSSQSSLSELLTKDITPEEELKYEIVCFRKQEETDATRVWMKNLKYWRTLSSFQQVLQYNLNVLELAGYVSSSNDYQDVLNDIAKDIVNRWKFRICRKEEISKLNETQKQLDAKTLYYCEKLDFYNKYVHTCLENLEIGKKNRHQPFSTKSATSTNEVKNKRVLKYTGSKLYEKGILIEINDLDIHHFKNAQFEISPTEDVGIFFVEAKFCGVRIERVEVDIQELLNLQYQGVAVITMFECAKVNINLLLFLINSKFYGKNM